jgi:hypothetical protein
MVKAGLLEAQFPVALALSSDNTLRAEPPEYDILLWNAGTFLLVDGG